jgi:hypothetical protein
MENNSVDRNWTEKKKTLLVTGVAILILILIFNFPFFGVSARKNRVLRGT